MKKSIIYSLIGLVILLTAFSSCNDTNDVAEIFTGKKWVLTYIARENDHKWYRFSGISDDNYMKYINKKTSFSLVFGGSEEDNVIRGNFTSDGSLVSAGNWNANAKNTDFKMYVNSSKITDSSDKLAAKILEGMKNAYSYKGSDSYNLYLYYKQDIGGETLCMVFARANQ